MTLPHGVRAALLPTNGPPRTGDGPFVILANRRRP
jgi:hypothetical protein